MVGGMNDTSNLLRAPFTDEQVSELNAYQDSAVFHPFTCNNSECRAILVAVRDGWVCPNEQAAMNDSPAVQQTWAHRFMADGTWRMQPNISRLSAENERGA